MIGFDWFLVWFCLIDNVGIRRMNWEVYFLMIMIIRMFCYSFELKCLFFFLVKYWVIFRYELVKNGIGKLSVLFLILNRYLIIVYFWVSKSELVFWVFY